MTIARIMFFFARIQAITSEAQQLAADGNNVAALDKLAESEDEREKLKEELRRSGD